ncbi:MAG: sugar transferase [Phycisphaerales bacterium]
MTAATETEKVWGLDALGLHDRFWAARSVRIIRRGVGSLRGTCADAFLLLEPDDLVLFDPPAAANRLVSVRLAERGQDGYTERVIADDENRLVSLRRLYTAPVHCTCRMLVTSDPAMAWLWHRSPSRRVGLREVRFAAGLNRYRQTSRHGRYFDASDPDAARRFVVALMHRWDDVETGCSGVSARQSHVWIHQSASVEPGARFVGPVWIGAGVRIEARQVVVGPRIVNDRTAIEPVTAPLLKVPRRVQAGRKSATSPATRRRLFTRRLFDIAFSLVALTLTAPLFPLIMFAIWLDDGRPFFFAHTRQTLGGRNFVCIKFRTMCKNAEQLKEGIAGQNVCDGPQFHIEDDPRLLRVGRLLRRFHLDELPQFVNVLFGHMSVIGPRPSPDDENQFCPAWRDARLSVRPGVTGLWQVSRTRAPQADFQEWIRHDLDYVEHQSWGLDLMIIYKTTRDIISRVCAAVR